MNQRTILHSVLIAVLSLVATTATAHDFEFDGIYYNKNGDGTVSVTYEGSSYNNAEEYTGDVVIPPKVTYSGTTYSVTSIGDYAFYECDGLTSVTIPNSVTSIGGYAFYSCSGLKSVTIPNSVTSIGNSAFYLCSDLTSVTIGNSVTSIGNSAFWQCSGLTSIIIPNSVTSIGNSAFYWCRGLTSVTIGNSVTSIGKYAFYQCIGLKRVTIPNSVTSIGEYAFEGCSGLTSITIGNSVTSIGDYAFLNCSGLTSIKVNSENKTFDSRENCNAIIETATNTLHIGCKNTIIPNSVTSIGDKAFRYCSGLTSITIPNSVTSIGKYAFEGCSGLTSITIPNSVTSIGNSAFSHCSGLTSITIPNSVTSIGNSAFSYCSSLTSVTIGKSVTDIGLEAFSYCSGLTSVISKAVTPPTCGSDAFSTETYSVPLIVPSIAKAAYTNASIWSNFSNYAEPNKKITAIAINKNEANLAINNTLQLSATVTPEDATFADVLQWTSRDPEVATVDDNGLVTGITKGSAEIIATTCDDSNLSASYTIKVAGPTAHNFDVGGIYYKFNGEGTVEVTFKGSMYDEYANEYTGNVEIPSSVTYSGTTYSVTSIGDQAFGGCSGLTSVTIPNSVTSISMYAFYGCMGLTSVTIPNSVTSIGDRAFYACMGLTSVTIGNSVTSIGEAAFCGCDGLTSVTIPNSVSSIGHSAFVNCIGLKRVTISNSVTVIGDRAFDGCSGLTSVISKAVTPPTCGSNVFSTETYSKPLIVPSVAKEAYKAASIWSNFSNYAEPNKKITAIAINNNEANLVLNNTLQLTATVTPEDATFADVLQWTSSNSEVATVDDNGLVTAIAKGDAEIIATTCDGSNLSASYTIKVAHDFQVGDIYYNRTGDGTVSVTFKGSSYNEYTGEYTGDVVIPSSVTYNETTYSVTSIGEYAFAYCRGLKSVTIPNSVTSIGDRAFWSCRGLKSVTIPNSVTSIGNSAFSDCRGLTSVSIPNSVTSIGIEAFSSCSGLTSVTIPNFVTSIGYAVFAYCRGLTSVTIPNSVTSIGNFAFFECSGLISVTIPNSATSIGQKAFSGCIGLTSVISKAVTPPTCGSNVFSTETYSVPLIVPSVAKEAYQAASIWSNFSNYAEPERKITAMEFGASTFGVGNGKTLQLTAKVTPEDATFADVLQWTSSNPEVATVDDEGLVTSLALGSTVITATSCDYSDISATCTVVVCPKAANVNDLVEGDNIVGFGLQGVKMHNGVLYACTTAKSVNKSTPTFHGNDANNMAPYEDRNFTEFDQRDWVAISGLEEGFVGKELSYPFEANFADGVLTPSETITAPADATTYNLNTFRAENILHGGYSNYAEGDYKAYYVPARVNEVAKFMGLIETIGGVKYLYSNNANGRKDGEGIKVENCTIEDNSKVYSILEGILVADADVSTKAGVKIIMLDYVGQATGVEGVDTAAARIYSANGNIIIAAGEDGEAAVYDYTGRLIKSVPVVAGDNTAVPVMPGCYIVRTGVKTKSVVVK